MSKTIKNCQTTMHFSGETVHFQILQCDLKEYGESFGELLAGDPKQHRGRRDLVKAAKRKYMEFQRTAKIYSHLLRSLHGC